MSLARDNATYFPYIGGALVLAGIVHIASVLAMPRLAAKDAFARIVELAPLNELTLLPRPTPGNEPIAMADPAVATAVCRYNLAQAPFRISVGVNSDSLLSISFHDRYGHVFYALTDRAAVRGQIEAVVVNAAQKDALEADDSEDGPGPDLRLLTVQQQGFVFLRALAEQPGDYEQAQQTLKNVRCGPDGN